VALPGGTGTLPKASSRWTRRGFIGAALGAVPAAALFGQDASKQAAAGTAAPSRIKEYRTLEAACPHGVPIQGKLLLAHSMLTLP